MPKQQADALGRGAVATPSLPSSRLADLLLRWYAVVLRVLRDELPAGVAQAWGDQLVRRGMLGMALIGVGSLTPAFLPPDAPIVRTLHLQWLSTGAGRFSATLVLVAGMALLVDAWLRMRPREGSARLHRYTWLLWSLPVLLAPPLFSRDAYSYAAQGRIVGLGLNPYEVGPVYVTGEFQQYRDQVDPMWLFTPAPYGPLALQLQHAIVFVTGDNAFLAALAMRLPALASVALLAFTLPRLARRFGVSADRALWLGVFNPLVMMHLVGGAHGDAMMIALVSLALLLAARGQLFWASATIALSANFKQTAVLALIGVVGLAMQADTGHRSKAAKFVRASAIHGSVAAATFTVLTAVSGLGWGWIPNLAVPASLRSLLSPPTLLGTALEGLLRISGVPDSWVTAAVPRVQTLGLLVGLVVIALIAWRVGPRRPVFASASILLVLCASGPVVHPWYLLWGGVLLAACRIGERTVEAMVWVTLFFACYGTVDATVSNGTWALGVTAAAWLLVKMVRRHREGDTGDTDGDGPRADRGLLDGLGRLPGLDDRRTPSRSRTAHTIIS